MKEASVLGLVMLALPDFSLGEAADVTTESLFGIMRKLLLLVPLALLLPNFFGVWGIYAAEAISNPVTTFITFIVFERHMKGLKEKFSVPAGAEHLEL